MLSRNGADAETARRTSLLPHTKRREDNPEQIIHSRRAGNCVERVEGEAIGHRLAGHCVYGVGSNYGRRSALSRDGVTALRLSRPTGSVLSVLSV